VPHVLYFISAILIFVGSFFTGELSFDISNHDSYYLIAYRSILLGLAILFFLFGVIYRIRFYASEPRFPHLTSIHFTLTVVSVGLILTISQFNLVQPVYTDYSVYQDSSNLAQQDLRSNWILIGFGVFILTQFIFLFNLARVKKENHH
jgi:heme/copper-type cytochrome/quinol oxidase subunit 1